MIAVMNSATSSSIRVKPARRFMFAQGIPVGDPVEPLGFAGVVVGVVAGVVAGEEGDVGVPGLATLPPVLPLALPLFATLNATPPQSGTSPLAGARPVPRKPTTLASQFGAVALLVVGVAGVAAALRRTLTVICSSPGI